MQNLLTQGVTPLAKGIGSVIKQLNALTLSGKCLETLPIAGTIEQKYAALQGYADAIEKYGEDKLFGLPGELVLSLIRLNYKPEKLRISLKTAIRNLHERNSLTLHSAAVAHNCAQIVEDELLVLLGWLSSSLNLSRTLSRSQSVEIAENIIRFHPTLSLESVYLCFEGILSGRSELKLYEGIDALKINEALNTFEGDVADERDRVHKLAKGLPISGQTDNEGLRELCKRIAENNAAEEKREHDAEMTQIYESIKSGELKVWDVKMIKFRDLLRWAEKNSDMEFLELLRTEMSDRDEDLLAAGRELQLNEPITETDQHAPKQNAWYR